MRGRSDATETAEALLRKRIDNLRASLLRLRTHDARMLLEIRLAECEKELAAKAGASYSRVTKTAEEEDEEEE